MLQRGLHNLLPCVNEFLCSAMVAHNQGWYPKTIEAGEVRCAWRAVIPCSLAQQAAPLPLRIPDQECCQVVSNEKGKEVPNFRIDRDV
jgi:hypothetical protein